MRLALVVFRIIISLVLGTIVPLCTYAGGLSVADTLFINGNVITLDDTDTLAEAIAVSGGRIAAVGTEAQARLQQGPSTVIIDLEGKALLPGFIDSHSHLTITAAKLGAADLSPAPAGNTGSFADIRTTLIERIDASAPGDGDWVVGWGYDHSMLAENRHPTRDDLDRISTDYPIVLIHFSGHQAVLNSKGLERVGYSSKSADPEGGVIRRYPGSREPNGIIEEQAWVPVWMEILNPPLEEKVELTAKAVQMYVAQGFTTVQDGGTIDPQIIAIFDKLAETDQLPIDVIAFPYDPLFQQFSAKIKRYRDYQNRFRFGGAKLVLDGGSPGRTAFLREPYFVQLDGEQDYRGYPHHPNQAHIDERVAYYYRNDLPVNIHALGDAAVDQAIAAIKYGARAHPGGNRRTNLIHLQVLQEDQLDELAALDVTLTFQVAHNYYFGDLHREWTLGPERAARLNPIRSALNRGIPSTIHHDSPIHPVDQLMLIWAAVNRVTRSGVVLGSEQRISVMDALRASTINAAYQYFEENQKGTIEVGKLADLVVLSASPLEVEPMALKDIKVLETFKEGRSVYKREKHD